MERREERGEIVGNFHLFVFISYLVVLVRNDRAEYRRWRYITKTTHTSDNMDDLGTESSQAELYLSWIGALMGTILVGLSGLMPMLIIPLDAGENLRSEQGSRSLRLLLSFAVGGLLGDVFLHLFPESYGALSRSGKNTHTGYLMMGLWILGLYLLVRSDSTPDTFSNICILQLKHKTIPISKETHFVFRCTITL